jgi:outer membrane protein assembly factor BamB
MGYHDVDTTQPSPFSDYELRYTRGGSSGRIEIWSSPESRVAALPATTTEMLDAAFGFDRVCLAEAKGPVLCIDTARGEHIWRYDPPGGSHVLRIAYSPTTGQFYAVEWSYATNGPKVVLAFDYHTGAVSRLAQFSRPSQEYVFCMGNACVLSAAGEVINLKDGTTDAPFEFPKGN